MKRRSRNHGGARPGSGPKPSGRAMERRLTLRLDPRSSQRLDALAAHLGLSVSETVRRALVSLADRAADDAGLQWLPGEP